MCMGGGGASPPKVQTPPPAATPPTLASSQVLDAGINTRARAAAGAAAADNPTGSQGLSMKPTTAGATLLGQ